MLNDEIDSYISELRQTVSIANLHYEVWWVFKDKENGSKYIKTLNQYNLFFQTTIQAHFVATIISLYRVYETRKDTYNIQALINRLENTKFSREKLSELKALFTRSKPIWLKVNILRNKVFGHRNNKSTVSEAFEEADIKPSDLKELMELTKEILNLVSYEWDQSTHAFNLGAESPTKLLLQDLKKYHDLHSKQSRAE
ncbi:MAG: hypothetical protein HOP36_02520 [Methyloglobulus sp.]|nr:hypothetical protein [Methyloglobulus sp.]